LAKEVWRQRTLEKLDQLAEIIRENREIPLSELAIKGEIGVSTLYGYMGALLGRHKDIRFRDGMFSVVEG